MSENVQSFAKKGAIPRAIAFSIMTIMFDDWAIPAGMERKTGCEGLQTAVWQGGGHPRMMPASTHCFGSAK